ncbi:MAG: hypothetical protein ACAI35_27155 [Candidatus Methylacidiphilales bacterium]|nr:hypothetical protein [Candidatus Methylacidiphilales bacterium]
MAKAIQWQLDGKTIALELGSKVNKKDLYGYARHVAEKNGVVLERGYLCPDGMLLRRDALSLVKLDPQGTPVDEVLTEVDGAPAEFVPSSFDQPNPLESVPLHTLAGFDTRDVYPLTGISADGTDAAATGLAVGLYRTSFNYRKALQPQDALILVKENGETWLLAGHSRRTTFVGQTVIYDFFDAEASDDSDDADDLDFSMV